MDLNEFDSLRRQAAMLAVEHAGCSQPDAERIAQYAAIEARNALLQNPGLWRKTGAVNELLASHVARVVELRYSVDWAA